MTYEFTDDCLIHIDEIDNEHRRLFQMVNEAISLTKDTTDVTPIASNLIANLKDYAATHFAHEEAYMESINDPELPMQRTEHASFAKKINDFALDTTSEETAHASLQELLAYLAHWLFNHILSSDMMIGKMPSKQKSDPFAFTDMYKTGVPQIDEEHQRLFEIIKETNDLIHEELLHDKYDEIMWLLTRLREYTEFHFQDEEAIMKRIHYPELESQKRAHSAFVERLVEIDLSELDDMDNNQQEYLIELVDFLLNWLTNHILGSDKKIGAYMKEHDLIG